MPRFDFEKSKMDSQEKLGLTFLALASLAGAFFLLYKNRVAARKSVPLKDVDIEIRYDTEKDADIAFLAQNVVKIVRIVLSPLSTRIKRENAKLIFVFGGESWEMRTVNASDVLKEKIRQKLESREW